MFHHINTYYNSNDNLILLEKNKKLCIINNNNTKICTLCLCDENDNDLEFFNYNNNDKYILIKQCLCCPDIHEECLLYFLNISEETKCIICNKQLLLLHKKIIVVFYNYGILIYNIKKIFLFTKHLFKHFLTIFFSMYYIIQIVIGIMIYVFFPFRKIYY